jgi:type VI secretion system protein ImpK
MGATLFGQTGSRAIEPSANRRRDNLALVFQDLLTVIVRLRANRQTITDPEAFRAQMRGALKNAEREGTKKLYPLEDVRLAAFGIVAFLDESILNSSNPAFSDWARMPLQEEMFGHHVGGEVFFQNIDRLLSRNDSHGVADLLEIYSLCLLLGYRGKYGLGEQDSVRPVLDAIAEKIRRIRGTLPGLSPSWAVPEGMIRVLRADPWVHRLAVTAATMAVLVLAFFLLFKVLLDRGANEAHALTTLLGWVAH